MIPIRLDCTHSFQRFRRHLVEISAGGVRRRVGDFFQHRHYLMIPLLIPPPPPNGNNNSSAKRCVCYIFVSDVFFLMRSEFF